MSQKYRFKSLQFAKGGQEQEKTEKDPNAIKVFETGDTKTIDFELLDGTRQNFAYSHYITSWIGKEDDKRVIKIFFATHLVTIKGFCLDEIYDELIKFNIKSIKANNSRYASMVNDDRAFISSIDIVWKNEKPEDL